MNGPVAACDCPCHDDPQILHIAPCCGACPRCGQRFKGGLEAHQRGCSGSTETGASG
jgi:hypothetical protein